jgi:lipoate-protein ligase A
VSAPSPDQPRGLLVTDPSGRPGDSPVVDLTLPAVLLRSRALGHPEVVHVYRPRVPTVAFSARDLRSPGIVEATRLARAAGFVAVTRSPGGRMVAYDAGAVVIDHVTATGGFEQAGSATFAANAEAHVEVLRALGRADVRVGEVDGEYCPGEFSINVAGTAKVVGSAQRVTARAALFSTVVQVEMSAAVREVIERVSAALGYPLRVSSIAGLADFLPGLTGAEVADAFRVDYRARLGLADGPLPERVVAHACGATAAGTSDLPFHVDDWTRAYPLTVAGTV